MDALPLDYCRQIETYLCRKNDGHLIRVVGPSFDLVSAWEAKGIPLKIAFEGIDRAFERYHRKGPRRRPLKIDFCEADVLDAFDDWRRAVGVPPPAGTEPADAGPGRGESLPAHLSRVVRRLSEARAAGAIDERFDALIDRVSQELDRARASRGGVRGAERQALLERLTALDGELVDTARAALAPGDRAALEVEAEGELSAYRDRMAPEAYARARGLTERRLVRERFGLPTVTST